MVALAARLYAEPRLQQSVSPQVVLQSQILELSAEDLHERVQAELEENPALELSDEACFVRVPPRMSAAAYEPMEGLDRLCSPDTLGDDLRLQLARVGGRQRQICDYLIECLDERGFLDADLNEVAALLEVELPEVQSALTTLQSLEPAGIGARNLCECFLLQIARIPAREVPPDTTRYLSSYLGSEHRSPAQAARQLGLTKGDLGRIVKFVETRLYMWPADTFRDEQGAAARTETAVYPDAWIVEEKGELQVWVAQSWSQQLRVSDAYLTLERHLEAQVLASGAERERIQEKIRDARCFIHHLTRREAMLRRVTEAIIAHQRAFFEDGPQALQPLTRKEIAAFLQVHESTISRITRDKYLQLPNTQLVPFDYFFDNSLSAKAVLRHLVEREDRRRPLADAVLAERLQAAGYPLARRTVAKYRDHLGIPPANERRRA